MSVKIDMNMPKSCRDCCLTWGDCGGYMRCTITNEKIGMYQEARSKLCPLKEVK